MASRKGGRRFLRTMVLGVACLALMLWTAVDQFEVDPETVAELGLASGLVVLLVILAAGLTVSLWVGLRRLWRRRGESESEAGRGSRH